QERQHPEESRKTPEIPPKTSGIPPPAPPLEQVPKKQPPHQRRGDNDRIAPPPCHLKITQWNGQGLSNKRHTVQAAAIAKNIDVFILQETQMSKDKQFRLPGYQQYSVSKGPNSHGSMILVRVTIPSSEKTQDSNRKTAQSFSPPPATRGSKSLGKALYRTLVRPNGQESQHDVSHDRTQGGCGTCSPKNAIYTRHSIINILCDTGT
ncbi:hypothetical protein Hamer_G018083, partial [Homarus americanus]